MRRGASIFLGLVSVACAATAEVVSRLTGRCKLPKRVLFISDDDADTHCVESLREKLGDRCQIETISEHGANVWRMVQLVRGRFAGYDCAIVSVGRHCGERSAAEVATGLVEIYRAAKNAGAANVVAVTVAPADGIIKWQKAGAGGFIDAVVDPAHGSLADMLVRVLPREVSDER